MEGEATKKCPRCAEQVQAEAKVCRYCGHRFESRITPVTLRLGRLPVWPFVAAIVVAVGVLLSVVLFGGDFAEDFETLEPGDSREEIIELLGEPDYVEDRSGENFNIELIGWKSGDSAYSVALEDGEISQPYKGTEFTNTEECDQVDEELTVLIAICDS